MPTALIVEDEPEANKLLGMLIRLRGYNSAPAHDGREALAQLGRFSPDVVFLDLMLPDMSGFEVCRAVKAARQTCLVPVVVVSARIAARSRVDSFRAGADEFVAKPYTPDQIFGALARARTLRSQAEQDRIAGTARFGDPEEGSTARDLAKLRDLVLGRSPIPEAEAVALGEVIRDAEVGVEDWLRRNPGGPPASLDYELTRDGLAMTFHGLGWLDHLGRTPDDPLVASFARFDEAAVDRDADRLILVKRWA
ncbi:response regulator [Paludisphaera sp.]|uniref:response regulator transcription factor n=1 Tax=Paludisphaera sp. TaxID=2017432 RepID=UPI00301CF0B3